MKLGLRQSLMTGLLSTVFVAVVKGDGIEPETVGDLNTTGAINPANVSTSTNVDFLLSLNESTESLSMSADLAAMTTTSGISFTTINGIRSICSGDLIVMNSSVDSLTTKQVAMLCCDDPDGSSATMLATVADANPACTILYSLQSQMCNLTEKNAVLDQLGTVFSLVSVHAARSILNKVSNSSVSVVVGPSSYYLNGGNGQQGSSNDDVSTTVAMAVLYAVAGIIATAFLFIIISGAIRVHKHPERYGLSTDENEEEPSSKAKGLARAVLDSIPLVRFQIRPHDDAGGATGTTKDPESNIGSKDGQESQADYLTNYHKSNTIPKDGGIEDQESIALQELDCKEDGEVTVEQQEPLGEVVGEVVGEDDAQCPICFEKFENGEILRDLPCKHKFHALCVDPWLLESSSHCPLCRVDLSLERNEDISDDPPNIVRGENGELIIPPGYDVNTSMFNRFLDVWNAQLLPRDARRQVLQRFHHEAELRRQLRTSMQEDTPQNRSRWIRFVNSRRALRSIGQIGRPRQEDRTNNDD
uniref:ARAD1B14454p n=1 Tax=Blastobotrys adeninivorans TaxID=409370 RepID=A0A060T6A3_BLAAD